MIALLAQTVAGKFEWADVAFLSAFICFTVCTVLAVKDGEGDSILLRLGLALMAFAWWVS